MSVNVPIRSIIITTRYLAIGSFRRWWFTCVTIQDIEKDKIRLIPLLYGVRGVSQIKFTMSDSFLVFYDFDILSMIKRKNPFRFYCVILILNLSRLISPITILIFKVCRVWFLKCIFDFQNLTRLISKIWRVWFLKWHFWFPKFVAFDFSNDTRVWFPKFLVFYY